MRLPLAHEKNILHRQSVNVEQQKKSLQSMGSISLLKWTKRAFLLLALASMVAGYVKNLQWLYLFSAFLFLSSFSIRKASDHVINANKSMKKGWSTRSVVMVSLIRDSNGIRVETLDEDPFCWSFVARTHSRFPMSGLAHAEIYWLNDVDWPVMVIVESALFYPKETPVRLEAPELVPLTSRESTNGAFQRS